MAKPKSSSRSNWVWGLGLLLAALAPQGSPATPTLAAVARATERARPFDLPMPGDRPLRIAQADVGQKRAIVYLHGMCGAEKGADGWADLATAYGTLIALRADVPCEDRPGYKWPKEASAIQARIAAALTFVQDLRAGDLSLEDPILIGYSQGAHRAERLAAEYPHLYRNLVLGGPPTAASPDRLRHVLKVAILGGELEDTSHMIEGYLALEGRGIDAEFFTLPRAGHGGYGPEGRRIMADVFSYLQR